jgi:8-amino-3,8-dideoxy-alpha-D-manno-octulosonate transaminase
MDEGKLAIDGGLPVIESPISSGVSGPSIIGEEEVSAVSEVLFKQELFRYNDANEGQGELFEQEAAEFLNVKYAVMVNSGTSALVCALTGIGAGPGDEVIVPGYTYISTAAAVIAVGAVPVISEIDESFGLDPKDVEAKITDYTKAIVIVHMRGVPAKIDELVKLARKYNLKIVEDCCQCVGGQYKGKRVGTFGDVGAWSLNYFKTITAGEGGLTYTNDRDIYERARFAADPGLPMWTYNRGVEWQHEPFPRQTYRPSEVLAAIARVQLDKIEVILDHQRKLKNIFLENLDEAKGYSLQYVEDPEGDTGVSASIIVQDKELAKGYSLALEAEGVPLASIYNDGFPDRHIYSYWDSILEKRSPHPTGYPWKDPSYKGNVQYSKDMCPQTLSLLGRSLRFDFNMNMSVEDARLMAIAINKVDTALG